MQINNLASAVSNIAIKVLQNIRFIFFSLEGYMEEGFAPYFEYLPKSFDSSQIFLQMRLVRIIPILTYIFTPYL